MKRAKLLGGVIANLLYGIPVTLLLGFLVYPILDERVSIPGTLTLLLWAVCMIPLVMTNNKFFGDKK